MLENKPSTQQPHTGARAVFSTCAEFTGIKDHRFQDERTQFTLDTNLEAVAWQSKRSWVQKTHTVKTLGLDEGGLDCSPTTHTHLFCTFTHTTKQAR